MNIMSVVIVHPLLIVRNRIYRRIHAQYIIAGPPLNNSSLKKPVVVSGCVPVMASGNHFQNSRLSCVNNARCSLSHGRLLLDVMLR